MRHPGKVGQQTARGVRELIPWVSRREAKRIARETNKLIRALEGLENDSCNNRR